MLNIKLPERAYSAHISGNFILQIKTKKIKQLTKHTFQKTQQTNITPYNNK